MGRHLTIDNPSLCRIWKNKGDVWRLLQDVAVIIDGRTWNARDEPEVQLLLQMMTSALRLGCNCAEFLSLISCLAVDSPLLMMHALPVLAAGPLPVLPDILLAVILL